MDKPPHKYPTRLQTKLQAKLQTKLKERWWYDETWTKEKQEAMEAYAKAYLNAKMR